MAVDMGFELLIRIALRCINLSPRHMQERLVATYAGHSRHQELISKMYSGTECVVDHKLAVIVATRIKAGLRMDVKDFCAFSVRQTLAAECDEWKRDKAIINRPRYDSHPSKAAAKAIVCSVCSS